MLVTTLASLVAALIFLAAMLYAAVSDLRTRRIPNWLVISLGVAYVPLAVFAGYEAMTMAVSFTVAVLVFGLGSFCFAKGWIGGGDVKFGSVIVLWLGAPLALPYLLVAAIFGAIFTLAALLGLRLMANSGRGGASLRDDGVPYGPALACAALLLFQASPWANAL